MLKRVCFSWQGSVAIDTVHVGGIVLVKQSDCADENGCADNDTGVLTMTSPLITIIIS